MCGKEINRRIRSQRRPQIWSKQCHPASAQTGEVGRFKCQRFQREECQDCEPQSQIAKLQWESFGEPKPFKVQPVSVPREFVECQESGRGSNESSAQMLRLCREAMESAIAMASTEVRINRCTGPKRWKWLLTILEATRTPSRLGLPGGPAPYSSGANASRTLPAMPPLRA